jgi:hypothetical protein
MGPTCGPEEKIFKDLEANWKSIDKLQYVTYKDIPLTRRHLSRCAAEVVAYVKNQIQASL